MPKPKRIFLVSALPRMVKCTTPIRKRILIRISSKVCPALRIVATPV